MSAPQLTVSIQGVGVISADQANTYEQTCDSVAQLRSFTGITGIEVAIRGTTTPGDGGAGPFYWNSTSTAADDNGATTVRPNGVFVGAWTRLGYYATSSGGPQGGNGGLINTNNVTVYPNFSYGVKTGTAAYTVLLPALSSVAAGSFVEIQDVDYDAFTHNITVSANGSDEITFQSASALTWTLNINGVIARLRANGTYWRATFYGS